KDDLKKVSNVVYKIPCCCKRVYVGQSSQYLGSRVYQHLYSCRNVGRIKDKTALSLHHLETGHRFEFDNVRILDKERIRYKRNVSEMVHI
ncbi:GSCOCG00012361001-RA-CDS, partial [Cotesia congregata]